MRGLLRKMKCWAAVRSHLAEHGGYQFRGAAVRVPDDIDVKIRGLVALGEYEASECELIESLLPRDRPVVELGGCLGLVSNVVARRLAPGVPFVVVEANPRLIETCRHNATLGGERGNVKIESAAVSYDGDEVVFDVSDNVHISRLGRSGSQNGVRVPALTLSGALARGGIDGRFSLICDIEGAEIALLENDSAALARCDLMIIELHPREFAKAGRTLDEVVALIEDQGFVLNQRVADVFAFERAAGDA